MSGSIGSASLKIATDHKALSSGLDSITSKLSGWKSKVAGLLAAVSVGVAAGKAVETAGHFTALERTAQAINANVEQYQGLGKAAAKAGVEEEQFGTLLGKMNVKIGEAATVGGAATDKFRRLGLSLDELQGLSADEQFLRISDAIAKIEEPAKRAYAAQQLFEEEGIKLLPVMGEGAEKLRAFTEEQKRLGTVLSANDVGKLSTFKKSVARVWDGFEGAWNKLVVVIAPSATKLADRFSAAWLKVQPVVDAVFHGLEVGLKIVSAVVDEIFDGVEAIATEAASWLGITAQEIDTAKLVEDAVFGIAKAFAYTAAFAWNSAETWAAIGIKAALAIAKPINAIREEITEVLRIINILFVDAAKFALDAGVEIVKSYVKPLEYFKSQIVDILQVVNQLIPTGTKLQEKIHNALTKLGKTNWSDALNKAKVDGDNALNNLQAKIDESLLKAGKNDWIKSLGLDKLEAWADRFFGGEDGMFGNLKANLSGIDAWLDRLRVKSTNAVNPANTKPKPEQKLGSELGRILTYGSQEEYSVRVKFQAGATVDVASQQLKESKAANALLGGIKNGIDAMRGAKPLQLKPV